MSWISSLFKGKKSNSNVPEYQKVEIPPFWDDPYVGKSQDKLWEFGTGAMEGKLPETYMPLIQFGSQPFEDMLSMKNRDIVSGMEESAAKRGLGRGANISPAIAKAVADSSTTARYGDYTNTLANMRSILGLGAETVTGVRAAALTNQSQKNNYGLSSAQLEMGQNRNVYESDVNAFDYNLSKSVQSPGINDVIGQVGNLFGNAEGQDNLLGNLMGMFGGGSEDAPARGSAEGGGKKKTDWLQTGMDVAKLAAMFAA